MPQLNIMFNNTIATYFITASLTFFVSCGSAVEPVKFLRSNQSHFDSVAVFLNDNLGDTCFFIYGNLRGNDIEFATLDCNYTHFDWVNRINLPDDHRLREPLTTLLDDKKIYVIKRYGDNNFIVFYPNMPMPKNIRYKYYYLIKGTEYSDPHFKDYLHKYVKREEGVNSWAYRLNNRWAVVSVPADQDSLLLPRR